MWLNVFTKTTVSNVVGMIQFSGSSDDRSSRVVGDEWYVHEYLQIPSPQDIPLPRRSLVPWVASLDEVLIKGTGRSEGPTKVWTD